MLQELWSFLKNPVYEEDENTNVTYRLQILLKLLVIALVFSLILSSISGGLTEVFDFNIGEHAMEAVMEKYPPLFLLFAAVILAPLLEELICRGPMIFFKNKSYFKFVFYTLTLIFGFTHMTNFEMTSTTLLLSPFLVAPQISVGFLLGLIRIRFGLIWAMVLHSIYNFLLIGPYLLF